MLNKSGKQLKLETLQNQQLCDLVKDLQDKDSINKQLIQKLLDSMDGSKASSNVKPKLKAMESALLQLSKENNSYKSKVHLLLEQKVELI